MNRGKTVAGALMCLACLMACKIVQAHSASDAYLTLTADPVGASGELVLHGQWDIALRDLDFVLKLDDDGDGKLTWGEVRRHETAIEHLAYGHLLIGSDPGGGCAIHPTRRLIDAHADGAYMTLLFDVVCAPHQHPLTLSYSLFFAIDPSHRAIVVVHKGADIATAVLSPQVPRIDLPP